MKHLLKTVSLIVAVTLLISPTTVSAYSPVQKDIHSIELGNNSEVRIEDNSEKRIAEYYENDIKKQIAILNKDTGDIYYYDLSRQNVSLRNYSDNDILSTKSYTSKYNIQDFIQNDSVNYMSSLGIDSISTRSSTSFTFLKSKVVQISGQAYSRYLYGYTDSKQYKQNSWHFQAGVAVSVVMAAVGFLPGVGPVVGVIGSAAGILLSALTVQEWIKELYWVYQFKQVSPSTLEFICSSQFTYQKLRRVEVNGDNGYWETIETEPDWSIEYTRDDILTNPGLYY